MSQEPGAASVSVLYVVKNQDVILNGTVASGLLNQLTAELVGYFLFYPPLIIAERKLHATHEAFLSLRNPSMCYNNVINVPPQLFCLCAAHVLVITYDFVTFFDCFFPLFGTFGHVKEPTNGTCLQSSA